MAIDHELEVSLPRAVRPVSLPKDKWVNWHYNVERKINGFFNIVNEETGSSTVKGYNKTVKNIQALLKQAAKRQRQVRPLGGTWSFSDIAVTDDWLVDTSFMNYSFEVSGRYRAGQYVDDAHKPFFFQAGTKISEVNRVLETKFDRSFYTTGASNGQSLAGAMATGTHGSAFQHGGIQDHAIGFHIITGPNSHVWVERASDPATTDDFAAALGATLIRDDDTFNAVQVSLGGMGFIAGIMIKTTEVFLVEKHRNWMAYDERMKTALSSLDLSNLTLPGSDGQAPESEPYFFMCVVNPFDKETCSVAVQYKKDMPDDYRISYRLDLKMGPGYELLGVIGGITDALPGTVPKLVNTMMKQHLKPQPKQGEAPKAGTWGEVFDFTTPRSDALGASVGVPIAKVAEALKILLETQETAGNAAPLVFACRYVRPTGATLEFTRFAPMTCVIDIDGVNSDRANAFLAKAWAALKKAGIPHTQHWGKVNNYDSINVRERYGDAAVDSWLAARYALLDTAEKRGLFSNVFLERLGLD